MYLFKYTAAIAFSIILLVAAAPVSAQHAHQPANHGHAGHSHGVGTDLGTTTVLGMSISVAQSCNILTSPEGIFLVTIGNGKKPRAMRLWIGDKSAEGSVKTKAESPNNVYDVHLEIPQKLRRTSQLWIEVEPASGKKQKVAFDLKF